eukprot:101921-Chlamydomonas_euryale.AAC.1
MRPHGLGMRPHGLCVTLLQLLPLPTCGCWGGCHGLRVAVLAVHPRAAGGGSCQLLCWLVGQLAGWLVGWLGVWLVGCVAG